MKNNYVEITEDDTELYESIFNKTLPSNQEGKKSVFDEID